MLDIDFLFCDEETGEDFIVNVLCDTKAKKISELSKEELEKYILEAEDKARDYFEAPNYLEILSPEIAEALGYDSY